MYDYQLQARMLHSLPSETISVENVPPNVDALYVTERTKRLDLLPQLAKLEYLHAAEIREEHFVQVCAASQVTHLSANVYNVKSLQPIGNLTNLQVLCLFQNSKIRSLEGIERLNKLEFLEIANFSTSFDLEPIASCRNLKFLWLSGTTWTALRVNSLEPVASLTQLECLKLPGVRVVDRRLSPLRGLTKLSEVELPNGFSHDEFLALAAALPKARGRWLDRHANRGTG